MAFKNLKCNLNPVLTKWSFRVNFLISVATKQEASWLDLYLAKVKGHTSWLSDLQSFCFCGEHPLLSQETAYITSTRSRKHTYQKASSQRLAMVLKGLRKRSFCQFQWTLEGGVGSEDLWLSKASLFNSPWISLHQWDRRPWERLNPARTEQSQDDLYQETQPFLHVSSMLGHYSQQIAASTSELFNLTSPPPTLLGPRLEPEWKPGSSLPCFCCYLGWPESPPFRIIFSDSDQPLAMCSPCTQEWSPNSLAIQLTWLKVWSSDKPPNIFSIISSHIRMHPAPESWFLISKTLPGTVFSFSFAH